MKQIWLSLLFLFCCHPVISRVYTDSLDIINEQKLKTVPGESLIDVQSAIEQVNTSIYNKISLQEFHDLLQCKQFCSFFLLESSPSVTEIKFALGVKMYLYCLDLCEQIMLYKASKNHDSLNYWQEELFYEKRAFLQKNITRWHFN